MNKDKQASVIKTLIDATTELNNEFQEGYELVIEDAHALLTFVTESQEETQKQIEAVRGLIVVHEGLKKDANKSETESSAYDTHVRLMRAQLRTLTATLKPYLGDGQKLEV